MRLGAETDNLQAYLKYLQGYYLGNQENPDDNIKAQKMLEEAIALDPDFTSAYARLANTYFLDIRTGTGELSREKTLEKMHNLIQKALQLDESNAFAHAVLSQLFLGYGEWDKSIAEARRAVSLAPNDDFCYMRLGIALMLSGRYEEAIQYFNTELRLNPLNPALAIQLLGAVHRWMEKYEEAIPFLEKCLQMFPNRNIALMNLAASYAGAGREDEARATIEKVLKLNPALTLETFIKGTANKDPAALERFAEELRKAGMPSEYKSTDTGSPGPD